MPPFSSKLSRESSNRMNAIAKEYTFITDTPDYSCEKKINNVNGFADGAAGRPFAAETI